MKQIISMPLFHANLSIVKCTKYLNGTIEFYGLLGNLTWIDDLSKGPCPWQAPNAHPVIPTQILKSQKHGPLMIDFGSVTKNLIDKKWCIQVVIVVGEFDWLSIYFLNLEPSWFLENLLAVS